MGNCMVVGIWDCICEPAPHWKDVVQVFDQSVLAGSVVVDSSAMGTVQSIWYYQWCPQSAQVGLIVLDHLGQEGCFSLILRMVHHAILLVTVPAAIWSWARLPGNLGTWDKSSMSRHVCSCQFVSQAGECWALSSRSS
jgi:hypothetical protein